MFRHKLCFNQILGIILGCVGILLILLFVPFWLWIMLVGAICIITGIFLFRK